MRRAVKIGLWGAFISWVVLLACFVPSMCMPLPAELYLESPNPGDSWMLGSTQTISWTKRVASDPDVTTIQLLSTESGEIRAITTAVPAGETQYEWVVGDLEGGEPVVPGGYCLEFYSYQTQIPGGCNGEFSIVASDAGPAEDASMTQ